MLKELRKLEEIQKIDTIIFKKEDELDSLPSQNERLEKETEIMKEKLLELKNNITIQLEEKAKREEILKKGDEKLKSITGRQSAIRNKDEYNNLLREIDNIKRFNREIEEEIKDIDREVAIKDEEYKLIEEEYNNKIAENEKIIKENNEKIEQLEKEIDAKYDERDAMIENIKPAVIRKYQRIVESSRNGKALAIADNYICQNCNMTLPPQLYNNVLKASKIVMCPNCECILVPPHKTEVVDKEEEK